MAVRMKHPDETARLSTSLSGPDEDGGFYFDDRQVDEAKRHGWEVAHLPDPEAQAPEAGEDGLGTEEPETTDNDGEGGEGDGSSGEKPEDDGEGSEDGGNASGAGQPGVERKPKGIKLPKK